MKTPKLIVSSKEKGNQKQDGISGISRRDFLYKGGTLALGLGFLSGSSVFANKYKPVSHPILSDVEKLGWRESVQGYTYRRFSLFEALVMASEIGLRYFEIRSNLKLDTNRPDKKADENMPEDARKELKTRLADCGLSVPSVFADFNGEADQAKRLLEFWKGFGTDIIVAEPLAGSLDMLEKLFEEFGMKLGLHNHQKGQSNFWSPDIILEVCNGRGKQIGACCDGGQWVRSGLDPVECLQKLDGRIINFHLKDVEKKGDLQSPNTVIGQGRAESAKTLEELKKLNYKGLIVIDFEHDTAALQEDMARNIAFIEEQAKKLVN